MYHQLQTLKADTYESMHHFPVLFLAGEISGRLGWAAAAAAAAHHLSNWDMFPARLKMQSNGASALALFLFLPHIALILLFSFCRAHGVHTHA